MPEVSDDAAILIATSFQAFDRAKSRNHPETEKVDLMIAVVFLGFYLEENLDAIIRNCEKEDEIREFYGKKEIREIYGKKDIKKIGLRDKFVWFYHAYITPPELLKSSEDINKEVDKYLDVKFPGFTTIYIYRNKVAHGKITHRFSISDVNVLREQAKAITDELLNIVNQKEEKKIQKDISYKKAVNHFDKDHPAL